MKYIKYFFICLLFGFLVFRFQQFYHSHPSYHDGQNVSITTTLSEEPEFSNKGQKFRIKTVTNQSLYITTAAFPRYHYGQVMQLNGFAE